MREELGGFQISQVLDFCPAPPLVNICLKKCTFSKAVDTGRFPALTARLWPHVPLVRACLPTLSPSRRDQRLDVDVRYVSS